MTALKYAIRIMAFLGVVALLTGFWYHPGIPYQDPPPELLAKYNDQAEAADKVMQIGIGLIVIALIGKFVTAVLLMLKRK